MKPTSLLTALFFCSFLCESAQDKIEFETNEAARKKLSKLLPNIYK